ncbi:MAG: hypothetical protein WCV62_05980 [Candidatus Peribacteraceae bacterium]|jgi:hypothetical protein
MDKGPWKVRRSDKYGALVTSDDFTHDVTLTISGDFRNRAEKIKYAEWLAKRLNGKG